MNRKLPLPPVGLTPTEDPTFAVGPILPNNDAESRVAAFWECAEFVGGKWEGLVAVVCLRKARSSTSLEGERSAKVF